MLEQVTEWLSGSVPVGTIAVLMIAAWGAWRFGGSMAAKTGAWVSNTASKFNVGCLAATAMVIAGLAGTGASIGELRVRKLPQIAMSGSAEAPLGVSNKELAELVKDDGVNTEELTLLLAYAKQRDEKEYSARKADKQDLASKLREYQETNGPDAHFVFVSRTADGLPQLLPIAAPPIDKKASLEELEEIDKSEEIDVPLVPAQVAWTGLLGSIGLLISGMICFVRAACVS
jgi:hypothetical protein